jgi:hypothetical protein
VALKRPSFSLLLPILELSAWTMLVATEVGLIYYGAHRATHGASAHLGSAELNLPPDRWVEFALRWMPLAHSHTIITANLPGILPDLLISLPSDQPGKWHPSWVSLENWRCFTFPFYCLPAWWFVGYGLDALLARRHVRRAVLWTGTLLCLLFAVPLVGCLTAPPGDRADLAWLVPGLLLWTVLFGVFPGGWLRQKIRRRRYCEAVVKPGTASE